VNEIYDASTPDNVKALVAAAEDAVINGDIEVISVFAETPASVGTACADMPASEFDVMGAMGG